MCVDLMPYHGFCSSCEHMCLLKYSNIDSSNWDFHLWRNRKFDCPHFDDARRCLLSDWLENILVAMFVGMLLVSLERPHTIVDRNLSIVSSSRICWINGKICELKSYEPRCWSTAFCW